MLVVIGVVVVAVLAVGFLFLDRNVRKMRGSGGDEVRDALGGPAVVRAVDDKAICRGTASGPFNNLVGMGALGCNDTELLFVRWTPRAELRIPRSDIVEHTFVTEYLGKPYRAPLLQVTYRNPEVTEGEHPGQDVVAWEVTDPDAWNKVLKG